MRGVIDGIMKNRHIQSRYVRSEPKFAQDLTAMLGPRDAEVTSPVDAKSACHFSDLPT